MTTARRILLATTASLTLLFAGYAGGRTAGAEGPLPPSSRAPAAIMEPATMTTVMQSYNTAASRKLTSLEADFNQHLPSGVSPIVYVDWDKIATWYGMPEGPATVNQAIGDYLTAKTGRSYDAPTLALLAQAMDSRDAEGIVAQKEGAACLVVPEYPGISFNSFYTASFKIGQTDALAGRIVTIGMSTKEFTDFVNGHESWHCLDTRYIKDTGDGLAGAVKRNRAEMFADVGVMADAIRNGADTSLIDRAIAVHTTWAFLTGPAHAKLPANNDKHFESVTYATQNGLLALKARIGEMGIDNFRKLDRAQLRALDYEITDAQSLSYAAAQGLQDYYATGRVASAAAGLIAQMKGVAEASTRAATPAELAAQRKIDAAAATNGGLTEEALLGKLQARAGQLGNAASLKNQLQARQEMTDSLRGNLDTAPGAAPVTEAQLKLLLYSNPHLTFRK